MITPKETNMRHERNRVIDMTVLAVLPESQQIHVFCFTIRLFKAYKFVAFSPCQLPKINANFDFAIDSSLSRKSATTKKYYSSQ
jgi:hypothetical protein